MKKKICRMLLPLVLSLNSCAPTSKLGEVIVQTVIANQDPTDRFIITNDIGLDLTDAKLYDRYTNKRLKNLVVGDKIEVKYTSSSRKKIEKVLVDPINVEYLTIRQELHGLPDQEWIYAEIIKEGKSYYRQILGKQEFFRMLTKEGTYEKVFKSDMSVDLYVAHLDFDAIETEKAKSIKAFYNYNPRE